MSVLGSFQAAQFYPRVGLDRVKIIFNFRWLVICRVNFKGLGKCFAEYYRRGGKKQLPAASFRSPWPALLFQAVDPGAGAWNGDLPWQSEGCRAPLLEWRLPANCKFSSFWRWICSTYRKSVFQGVTAVTCLWLGVHTEMEFCCCCRFLLSVLLPALLEKCLSSVTPPQGWGNTIAVHHKHHSLCLPVF